MRRPKIGLLPLYIQLYDEAIPSLREAFTPFLNTVVQMFDDRSIDVIQSGICCVQPEFSNAVNRFTNESVDVIVTVHLAYSPSGESIDVFCKTDIPLVIVDTTMDHSFGLDVDPDRLSYNHGIHGVMDLAAMLRRRNRKFSIVAGHITESKVIDRTVEIARAAVAASAFKTAKTLRIGDSFSGMDDFAVSEKVMADRFGITVQQIVLGELSQNIQSVTEEEIAEEIKSDIATYSVDCPEDVHRRSVKVGLGLRQYIDTHGYTAFSMNFLSFDSPDEPVNTVPFLEACKAMQRGIGYAGEGDTLTASLLGAFLQGFEDATFTEIFCPDWKGDTLFLSHMGEINPRIAGSTPKLLEKNFPYTNALNPAFLACSPKPGPAVFINLSPGPDDSFRLIAAPVEILEDTDREDHLSRIRGWMKPQIPVSDFLEEYSKLGGTHHSVLLLGDRCEAVEAFAEFTGLECKVIR